MRELETERPLLPRGHLNKADSAKKRQGKVQQRGLANTALDGSSGWEDKNMSAGLTSQFGWYRPSSPRKVRHRKRTQHSAQTGWALSINHLVVFRRRTVGFRTCREGGALGGTPGFQTEMLEGSSLGSGGGGWRAVKVGEGC